MELNHTSKYIAPTIKRFIPTSTHPSYSRFCVFKHSTFPSQGVTAKRTRGIVLFLHFQKFTPRCSFVKIGTTLSLPICKKESNHVRSKPMSIQIVVLYQQNTTTRYQRPAKVLAFHENLQGARPLHYRKHCRFQTSRETSSFINPSNCRTPHRKHTY